jgi:hypothetical protein
MASEYAESLRKKTTPLNPNLVAPVKTTPTPAPAVKKAPKKAPKAAPAPEAAPAPTPTPAMAQQAPVAPTAAETAAQEFKDATNFGFIFKGITGIDPAPNPWVNS